MAEPAGFPADPADPVDPAGAAGWAVPGVGAEGAGPAGVDGSVLVGAVGSAREAVAGARAAVAGEVGPLGWAAAAEAAWALVAAAQGVFVAVLEEVDRRGVARELGATSTVAWLRGALRLAPDEARTLVGLARAVAGRSVDGRRPGRGPLAGVGAGLAAGELSLRHAVAVATAVGELPSRVGPGVRADAEALLVAESARFDPREVAQLGRRVLEVVAPEVAEAELARSLAEQERVARRNRELSFGDDGHGQTFLRGRGRSGEGAALVRTAVEALAGPVPGVDGRPDERTAGQRRWDALEEICRWAVATAADPEHDPRPGRPPGAGPDAGADAGADAGDGAGPAAGVAGLGPDPDDEAQAADTDAGAGPAGPAAGVRAAEDFDHRPDSRDGEGARCPGGGGDAGPAGDPGPRWGGLPSQGGQSTRVSVTVPLSALVAGIGHGTLDDGTPLSPGLARRWACDAGIIPMVLGGASEVLDIGRAARRYTVAMRRAITARDRCCTFPGCTRPATWCEVHHPIPWWAGGPTSVANGILLCRYHHSLIHDGEWEVRMAPDGHPEFLPPAWIDPTRTPRRNPRPPPEPG